MRAGLHFGSAGSAMAEALDGHREQRHEVRREWPPVPAAVLARDEEGPRLPQMVAQRAAALQAERELPLSAPNCPYCRERLPRFGNVHVAPGGEDLYCHAPLPLDHNGSVVG